MTNKEKFNQLLNSCQNPQAIAVALYVLFSDDDLREKLWSLWKEGKLETAFQAAD